jgi:O-antigen/teichoic acid export membrane protein
MVVVLLAEEALSFFGEDFAVGWTALIICSGAQLFSTVVGPSPRMLAMTGNQNVVMTASIIGVVTGIIGTVSLSPVLGIVGAAIGVSAAITTENAISLTMVRRRFGFWPFTPQYLKPLMAGLLGAGIAYAAKLGFSSLGAVPGGFIGTLLTIAVTGTVFGISYVAFLLLFRLSATDREFLGTFWQVARRYLRRGNRNGGDREGAE